MHHYAEYVRSTGCPWLELAGRTKSGCGSRPRRSTAWSAEGFEQRARRRAPTTTARRRRGAPASATPAPLVGQASSASQLACEVVGVAGREARRGSPAGTRPRGPPRSPRAPSGARRAAASRPAAASAATIPNASGKIDGTTVTSQSGIRWTRWRCSSGPVKSVRGGAIRLELLAVVAEADDDRRARRAGAARRRAHGRPCCRAASRSRGRSARRSRTTPRAARRCPRRAAARSRSPGFGGSRRHSVEQRGERDVALLRAGTRRRRRRAAPRARARRGPTTSSSTSRMCSEPT